MKTKKILAFALCIFMALTVLTACSSGGSGNTVEGDTIKIGIFQSLTGDNGGMGSLEALGTKYGAEKFPTVTIDGKEYKIDVSEVADNATDKTVAVTAAQNLINANVIAAVGSCGSGVSIAAGPTFQKAGVPVVGASCSNPQVTVGNDFYFRVCLIDTIQGPVAASYAFDSGCKKAALLNENGDDYSTGLCEFFKASFTEKGGEVVSEQTYQTGESDFKAMLNSIKEAGADIIYCPSAANKANNICQQAKALGMDSVMVLAADTWEMDDIITDNTQGAVFTSLAALDPNTTDPIAQEFIKGFGEYLQKPENEKFRPKTGESISASCALGYDAYLAVYEALKSLDGQNLEKITSVDVQKALKTVEFDGVTGHTKFDENGDSGKTAAYIKKVDGTQFSLVKVQGQ